MNKIADTWKSGDSYEYFMGRWSNLMATEFLKWLSLPSDLSWLDIGCGTGALSKAIAKHYSPSKLFCVDPSKEFLEKARENLPKYAELRIGNAAQIPIVGDKFDIIVSGLALNFFPDLHAALSEMKRVAKPKSIIAAYVWDYSGQMEFLRYFWNAALHISPQSLNLDEGKRFPICNSDNLTIAFKQVGITEVKTTHLDIYTIFNNFEDYWNPFLGNQGPAPGYLASLPEHLQTELRNRIYNSLPFESDGTIKLIARAIAIQGA